MQRGDDLREYIVQTISARTGTDDCPENIVLYLLEIKNIYSKLYCNKKYSKI